MSKTPPPDTNSRRSFLKSLGILSAGAAVAVVPAEAAPRRKRRARGGALGEQDQAYVFFTEPEAAFVEAAVDRLIPADETGPGAKESGVAYFIDGQLDGAYGTFAKNYKQGPWADGTPEQGYQLRMTPSEVYRASIRGIDDYWIRLTGGPFTDLDGERQDDFLHTLEDGNFHLASVPDAVLSRFWTLLHANTVEGYFADPAYGGNADMAAWKMVGFPGVVGEYKDIIEDYDVAYTEGPVSLAQVQQGEVSMEHGHEHEHGGGPKGMATVEPRPDEDHHDEGDHHDESGEGGHHDAGGSGHGGDGHSHDSGGHH